MDAAPRHPALLVLLSVAAGCVDAIAFLQVGVFPANMTGNSVVFALNLLERDIPGGALAGFVLLAFCMGAALAAWILHPAAAGWSRHACAVLVAAGVVVLACALALGAIGSGATAAVVVASALAMGMQSAAAGRIGVAGVTTVVVTGTLTTAIARLVANVRRPVGNSPVGPDASPSLPALSWLGYFGGALLGGVQVALHIGLPFLAAALLMIAAGALAMRRA